MKFEGYYYNQHQQQICVTIVTDNDTSAVTTIGEDADSDLLFADSPVSTESQVTDTFDHLLMSHASVTLLCRNYVAEFYAKDHCSIRVRVDRDGECVFLGFVEPRVLSQDYNEEYDEVELNCIDCLSALRYSNYRNIGDGTNIYSVIKAGADERSLLDVVKEIIGGVTQDVGDGEVHLWYDGSVLMAEDGPALGVWSMLVSELVYLDDDEESVWTQETVLAEILRYLNLHIVQQGTDFYIFSWDTVRNEKSVTWTDLLTGSTSAMTRTTMQIETEKVADCGTQIEIGEVYNVISLTDSVTEIENVIESPLDDDSILNAFDGKQKYMTELYSKGTNKKALAGFKELVDSGATSWTDATVTDWFVQAKTNAYWKFYAPGKVDMAKLYFGGKNQQEPFNRLGAEAGVALLAGVGKVKKDNGGNDNSPTSTVSMTNYLILSTCGNGLTGESTCYPSDDIIKAAIPMAEYTGSEAGGNFSPADDQTTNYIVVSGKIVLNPLMRMSGWYNSLHDSQGSKPGTYVDGVISTVSALGSPAPVKHRSDSGYHTRQHWAASSWKDTPQNDTTPDKGLNRAFIPWTEDGVQSLQFNYSAIGDSTDQISKVPVVACMLVIGDKCAVEKLPDDGGSGNGQVDDFEWRTYKERSECADDEEYYSQCFTIGFDPKIGDYLVGTEFGIQNNISYTMGLEEEGTAIPIHKSDRVHGKVQFKILGLVNTVWDNVTRRHKTWFRHTKWTSSSVPVLAATSNVQLGELEIKAVSDNGLSGGSGSDDSDIVYMSDTDESFRNKKDDIEFKIVTALTSDECKTLGVTNAVKQNSPTDAATDEAVLTVYSRHLKESAKPEQLYVDQYWREWHKPRIVMTQNFDDENQTVDFWHFYTHPALGGKQFHVQAIERDLTGGTATVTLKEFEQD